MTREMPLRSTSSSPTSVWWSTTIDAPRRRRYCAAHFVHGGFPTMTRSLIPRVLGTPLLVGALLGAAGRALGDEPGYGRPIDISLDGNRSDFLFNLTTISITILFV